MWDGGTFPELYWASPGSVEHLGAVLTLRGEVYSGFVTQFEPFRPPIGLDAQGLHDFLRAYYHVKSADWPQNQPHPLRARSA